MQLTQYGFANADMRLGTGSNVPPMMPYIPKLYRSVRMDICMVIL
jgi:hypothetical protein